MKRLAAVLSLAAMPGIGHAGFVDESSSNPFSSNHQLRQIGNGGFDQAHGFGREVAFEEAVAAIVPDDFNVSSSGMGELSREPVDWSGGEPWNEVLASVLKQTPKVQATIDTGERSVSLSGPHEETDRSSEQRDSFNQARRALEESLDTSSREIGDGITEERIPQQEQIQPQIEQQQVSPQRTWNVTSGSSLRDTLNDWSSQAGWQVAWELQEDLVIGAQASFRGSLDAAIDALMNSLHGTQDIRVELWGGNRVIRVTHRTEGVY